MASINISHIDHSDNTSELSVDLLHPNYNPLSNQLQYYILLLIVPWALACNLFVLYHLLFDKNLRSQLHNHIIILILFSSLEFKLIHVPFSINLFRTGSIWPRSVIACSIWRFTAYTGCNANDVLLAWAAVERHVLIYNSNAMNQKRNRFIFHYGPMTFLAIYLFVFNALSFFTPTCFAQYDFTVVFCDATCLGAIVFMSTWYLIFNQLFAAFLAIGFSLGLLIRVIQQRKNRKRKVEWRRLNKLTAQVLVITVLFIFLEVPYAITGTLDYIGCFRGSSTFNLINAISLFLCYVMPIVMPFACFVGLFHELWPKLIRPIKKYLPNGKVHNEQTITIQGTKTF